LKRLFQSINSSFFAHTDGKFYIILPDNFKYDIIAFNQNTAFKIQKKKKRTADSDISTLNVLMGLGPSGFRQVVLLFPFGV